MKYNVSYIGENNKIWYQTVELSDSEVPNAIVFSAKIFGEVEPSSILSWSKIE